MGLRCTRASAPATSRPATSGSRRSSPWPGVTTWCVSPRAACRARPSRPVAPVSATFTASLLVPCGAVWCRVVPCGVCPAAGPGCPLPGPLDDVAGWPAGRLAGWPARSDVGAFDRQSQEVPADGLEVRLVGLDLLGDGVHVAEATLEALRREDGRRAGGMIDDVDDAGRVLRPVRRQIGRAHV